jgi:hypothetical protein
MLPKRLADLSRSLLLRIRDAVLGQLAEDEVAQAIEALLRLFPLPFLRSSRSPGTRSASAFSVVLCRSSKASCTALARAAIATRNGSSLCSSAALLDRLHQVDHLRRTCLPALRRWFPASRLSIAHIWSLHGSSPRFAPTWPLHQFIRLLLEIPVHIHPLGVGLA